MQEYKIRVFSSGHPIVITEGMHLSDHAAVRSAKDIAGDRPFEVWRGLDCIHSPPKAHAPLATRSRLGSAGAWMKRVLRESN